MDLESLARIPVSICSLDLYGLHVLECPPPFRRTAHRHSRHIPWIFVCFVHRSETDPDGRPCTARLSKRTHLILSDYWAGLDFGDLTTNGKRDLVDPILMYIERQYPYFSTQNFSRYSSVFKPGFPLCTLSTSQKQSTSEQATVRTFLPGISHANSTQN
jgi:hypothetical protein